MYTKKELKKKSKEELFFLYFDREPIDRIEFEDYVKPELIDLVYERCRNEYKESNPASNNYIPLPGSKSEKIFNLLVQGKSKYEIHKEYGYSYPLVQQVYSNMGYRVNKRKRKQSYSKKELIKLYDCFKDIERVLSDDESSIAEKIRVLNTLQISRYDISKILETPYSYVKRTLDRDD